MALKEEIDMGQVYSFDDKYGHQDDLNRNRKMLKMMPSVMFCLK